MTDLTLPSFARFTRPEILSDVRKPDCNLAIWERENVRGVETLLQGEPCDLRFTTGLSQLPDQLSSELDACGFLRSSVRSEIEADFNELAKRYCAILSLDELEVRLELITTNSCRKWHSDYVKARLISTYIGQGTQWLDAPNADRVKRGLEPIEFGTMRAGDVGLFKGKLATDKPAIHRSPPIAGTGETRLLLVLNPPEEL